MWYVYRIIKTIHANNNGSREPFLLLPTLFWALFNREGFPTTNHSVRMVFSMPSSSSSSEKWCCSWTFRIIAYIIIQSHSYAFLLSARSLHCCCCCLPAIVRCLLTTKGTHKYDLRSILLFMSSLFFSLSLYRFRFLATVALCVVVCDMYSTCMHSRWWCRQCIDIQSILIGTFIRL